MPIRFFSQSNTNKFLCSRLLSHNSSAPGTPDIAKSQQLLQLFHIENAERDDAWRTLFLENVTSSSLKMCTTQHVKQGPDGFNYLHLLLPRDEEIYQAYSIENLIEPFLLKNGLGVAIESSLGTVEWIFSHGKDKEERCELRCLTVDS